MYRDRTPLFSSRDGSQVMQNTLAIARDEVDKLPEDRLLGTDPDALTQYYVEKFAVEVPVLDTENMTAAQHERQVEVFDHFDASMLEVPGVAFDFELPFTGEADIFKLSANTYGTNPPHAQVTGQLLKFSIAGRELDPAQVKGEVDRLIASIEQYLGWHRSMWASLPGDLAREVRQQIDQRRGRLMKQKEAASELSSMGFKLREKSGDARTYAPPAVKQRVEPKLPPMRPATKPEPALDQAQYDRILGLIRDAGRSVEQSSSRMRELDEEALRDIFLVPLNAHFGSATGEAFNHLGKTDVLIKHEGSNLFVAEFKIWGGNKRFLATISQLLSYLTWRDTKAAIVVFSRNAGFTAVVAKLRELAKAHPNYVSGPVRLDDSSDRFEFSLPQDGDRHVMVSVLAFNLA